LIVGVTGLDTSIVGVAGLDTSILVIDCWSYWS
jgi:hypothetical protein